jgi:hypothetical protein
MALVVETGAGTPGANAYVSVAAADAYFEARNNAAWAAATDEDKERTILEATAYIDGTYQQSWSGRKATAEQGLAWPRYSATDADSYAIANNVVPTPVVNACCELAVLALSKALQPSESRGGQVVRSRVGPIETEYASGAPSGRTYPFIDTILAPLVGFGSGGNIPILRA